MKSSVHKKSSPVRHCSFCGKAGHLWPTCKMKFAVDSLSHRFISTVISDEIDRYFSKHLILPAQKRNLLLRSADTILSAYNRAGKRWHLTLKPLRRLP